MNRTVAENQARPKSYATRIRELEEETQVSDRTGVLEISLKGTHVQKRAEALEFQLLKSKQVSVWLLYNRDVHDGRN